MDKLFIVTAPGIAPYTLQELSDLGLCANADDYLKHDDSLHGGVELPGDMETIMRANLHLRTASRILVRIGGFYAESFAVFQHNAARLPWQRYLKPGQPVALRVTCQQTDLYLVRSVERVMLAAISERLKVPCKKAVLDEEGSAELPQIVVVRIVGQRVTISVDTSGHLLHRRGYRLATAKAPLRETLAAAILMASGWKSPAPLIDPFCGSGTFPIEAAMLAANIPPGLNRMFAFMNWPSYDPALWEKVRAESVKRITDGKTAQIYGSDRDAGAINASQENAARAGVESMIQFSCHAVSAIQALPENGWIVTNPPYGVRVSARNDLRNLYAQFGNVLRARFKGWHFSILCNDDQLISHTHMPFDKGVSFVNGGIGVKLSRGKVI